ncbi:MAG: signal recognition particle receptor subunit alpha, partial [Flavobacteriaceae bacterium]
MFDQLSTKIEGALHKLRGKGKINELNIAESMKEIRKALLDADVNYKIAKDFTNTVKEKAMGQHVLQSLQPGQLMVKIVRDELASLMGSNASELQIGSKLSVVLMAGLQGSGKTTFSGKLANYLKTKKSKKP